MEAGASVRPRALAWELALQPGASSFPAQQHREYRWVGVEELALDPAIHPNSRAYAANLTQSPTPPRHV